MNRWIKDFVLLLVFLVGAVLFFHAFGPLGEERRSPRSVEGYMRIVSDIWGLEFEENVIVEEMGRGSFREYVENRSMKKPSIDWMEAERTLRAFGLLPERTDLKETVVEHHEEQTAGFYDYEKDKLYVVENRKGREKSGFTLTHELAHALQDQVFDLQSLPFEAENNDDLFLAVESLVEGGAYYVSLEYRFRREGRHLLSAFDRVESRLENFLNTSKSPGEGDNYPLFLEKNLLFPYFGGLLFTVHGARGGWENMNRAYSDPPASTEQVLHPDKYFENRDNPTLISLPSLGRTLGGEWELQENNSFGEYSIGALFLRFFRAPENVDGNIRARTGWDGDSYLTYYSKEENLVAIAWLSTWDSEEDSIQFRRRYLDVLGEKHPGYRVIKENETLLLVETGEGRALLERRGCDVLVLEGIPNGRVDPMAERVWSRSERRVLENAYNFPSK